MVYTYQTGASVTCSVLYHSDKHARPNYTLLLSGITSGTNLKQHSPGRVRGCLAVISSLQQRVLCHAWGIPGAVVYLTAAAVTDAAVHNAATS